MKVVIFSAMAAALLGGCSAPAGGESDSPPATAPKQQPVTNAQQVLDRLRGAGLPIDKIRTITAESDANKLLGRPHQYTSKIDFIDTRFAEGKVGEATNNIEVFAVPEDAQRRSDYIDGVMKEMPLATQYLILRKNVLVRIDGAVSPDAAKEYEEAVAAIIGN